MALTISLINKASDHLAEKHIQLWLMLFRKLPRYQQYAAIYSDDIEARIRAAEGTLQARMLNALMKEIDALGIGEVMIGARTDTITKSFSEGGGTSTETHGKTGGGRDALYWSQSEERLSLVDSALDVLYDDISLMIVAAPSSTNTGETASFGGLAATGQRSWTDDFFICGNCGVRVFASSRSCIKGGRRTCGCR